MVQNAALLFAEIPPPATYPVPGKHTKRTVSEIDLDAELPKDAILVKNSAFSLDPYMRGRMRDAKIPSYTPAFDLGKPITSAGIGQVVKSSSSEFSKGDTVLAFQSVQEYNVLSGDVLKGAKKLDNTIPAHKWLSAAGMPSMTAWLGLELMDPKPQKGETIFVSGAAGAVGQIVAQLCKRRGLKVIGSAGSDEKVDFLKQMGYDVAFNYKTTDTAKVLKENAFQLYFDNVGGETLSTVLDTIDDRGRIAFCGAISDYNRETTGIKNYAQILYKSLNMRGFIVGKFPEITPRFYDEVPALVAKGELDMKEHVTKGIDDGEALLAIFHGGNFGKAIMSLE